MQSFCLRGQQRIKMSPRSEDHVENACSFVNDQSKGGYRKFRTEERANFFSQEHNFSHFIRVS